LLKKSVSELTASSGFSMISSNITTSSLESGKRRAGRKEAKAGETKRAWDWREDWADGASGEGVLQDLRMALAREVARAWMQSSS